MQNFIIFLTLCFAAVLVILAALQLAKDSRLRSRLASTDGSDDPADDVKEFERQHKTQGLGGWLYLAGFRRDSAVAVFLVFSTAFFCVGLLARYQLEASGAVSFATELLLSIPGGAGNVIVPFVLAIPWLLIVILTIAPTLVVRSARRNRIKEIEQDLPLMLDLLNTLAQSGIGLDSAIDRVLSSTPSNRPLATEFRIFQIDILAGRSRSDAWKSLMRRVDIPVFSSFISAILQAEIMGAGLGETMKVQAREIRHRRREKASAAAMAIPTLLVLPMVIGFLPGIFIVIIGPLAYEALGGFGQTLRGVAGL